MYKMVGGDRVREGICDFCGASGQVIRTDYGTSHYVRLICEECRRKVEFVDGLKVQDLDEEEE